MAQPRQRKRRLLAALLVLLSLCCLPRLGGAASAASAATSTTDRKDGAATSTEKAPRQEAARGFTATTAERVVPVRAEMEVDVQDYPGSAANARHDPGYGYRGGQQPQHPWP